MKVIAQFDVTGKIRSVVAFSPVEGLSLTPVANPGEHVAEIQGHGLTAMPEMEKLRELARSHSIVDPLIHRTIKKIP